MDVRKSIIYCYLQMEEEVEMKGSIESENMTPREFKAEVIRVFGIGGQPLDRLVLLFEEARYSTHDLDEGKRSIAIDSLISFKKALEGRV